MRALNATFELFDTAELQAAARNRRMQHDSKSAERGEPQWIATKYKNSGNEAKEYLKTKDITFLNGANCARFARGSTPIRPQKEPEPPHFAKTMPGLAASPQGAATVTNSRLVFADRIPRHIAERRGGRGFSPATEGRLVIRGFSP